MTGHGEIFFQAYEVARKKTVDMAKNIHSI